MVPVYKSIEGEHAVNCSRGLDIFFLYDARSFPNYFNAVKARTL